MSEKEIEERIANRELEALIAAGLYKTRSETIKDHLRQMLSEYKEYIMSHDEVKRVLAEEIPQDVELSEEIVAMRRRELERYLEE